MKELNLSKTLENLKLNDPPKIEEKDPLDFLDEDIEVLTESDDDEPERKYKNFLSINEKAIPKAKETLNEDQSRAFDMLIDFLDDEDLEYFTIIGYAGTGKTYLISKLCEVLNCPIAVTAPTNKAVKVLKSSRSLNNEGLLDYLTIHKLLALKVQWEFPTDANDLKQPEQKLTRNTFAEILVNNYGVIIVDEVSMLDDEIFEMLNNEKKKKVKVIFMGDPAQIPPVNRMDAIPLLEDRREEYNIKCTHLTQIMRQASDNKILLTAGQIRNRRFDNVDPILNRTSNNDVIFCNSMIQYDRNYFRTKMLEMFKTEAFNEDPNFCKCIAYTNRMVDEINQIIRTEIYKGQVLAKYMIGEKLIIDKPVIVDNQITFNTSDEIELLELNERSFYYKLPNTKPTKGQTSLDFGDDFIQKGKSYDYEIKYYEARVKYKEVDSEEPVIRYVDILTDFGEQAYKWALSALKKKQAWREYYKLYERFAKVKYNYAITAHKSQGSTYVYAFIIEDDIDINKRTLERNRIKYTACTRPKYKLYILSKLNIPLEKQANNGQH